MKNKVVRAENPIPTDAVLVFKGVIFDVYQWQQELYDGTFVTFEKLRRQDAVNVISILPDRRFLLCEDEQPGRETVLTFPGGQVDVGEDPAHAAARELVEETGYASAELLFLKSVQPTAKIDWCIFTFIARACEKIQEAEPGAGERITTHVVTLDELIDISLDARFQNIDMIPPLVQAKYDSGKRAELEQLLYEA